MTATSDSAPATCLRGVVFDFDGVIADTEPLHLGAYQDVLAATSMVLDAKTYYDRYLGYDDVGVFQALSRDQGVSLEEEMLQRLIAAKGRRFEARVRGDDVLFPDAAACIERLARDVPLAIASGALHHEIEAILTSTKLRQHFGVIVAADDVPRSKPAPDSYERAVSLLSGQDSATDRHPGYVAIEDSLWGIQAAHAAGLKCVAVTNSYPAETLATADLVVAGLGDLQLPRLEQLWKLDERGPPVR